MSDHGPIDPSTTRSAAAPERLVLDGHKIEWHHDRLEAWLRGERIAPITVDLALTRACSYRCVYCYGKLQANDIRRMTGDVVRRFFDDAAAIGVRAVSLISDGESTCSPHFYDAVAHARANGLDVGVATNGFLLAEERLEDLLARLTYLRFNISAATPADYARIHGCDEAAYRKVVATIRDSVRIKRERRLPVTLGLQMVLMPDYGDQILPLARLGKELGVDYLVIKHCSDDELGSLAVDYRRYFEWVDVLKAAEAESDDHYLVRAKWSKLLSEGKRVYSRCHGPPFMIQLSGSGLVAPCGMLFNRRYQRLFHIGNIAETPFREIWRSERYWEVMGRIASDEFDARTMCGCLCLQHKINEHLWGLRQGTIPFRRPVGAPPAHHNFI
jgi:MoaA/NifB/PqqE/SkfB family radical SAM enzyme